MMEDNFRTVLIILSAIVIAAIFIHGFWTIRKNKNPYKLKAKAEKIEPMERGFDSSGFDQDGVGRVRVVSASTLNDDEIPHEPAPAPNYDEEPLPHDLEERQKDTPTLEPTLGDLHDIHEQPPIFDTPPQAQSSQVRGEESLNKTTAELNPELKEDKVYQEPVIHPKKTIARTTSAKKKPEKSAEHLKRNQMEINFGDAFEAVEHETSGSKRKSDPVLEKPPEIEPEVIVVSVVMTENNLISGAALLPTLLTLGLRFGDMDIFHRHQDNAGNGKVTFSLANMMNPGTFNLDDMESFTTQGVSLFMTLPNAGDPFEVFEQMMSAAKQLCAEFNGQLLDDKRSVMTKQTEQHYISKIREFDRRSRIAHA
ncbi:cell division protein ZipA [Thalassotalea ganghwensis]